MKGCRPVLWSRSDATRSADGSLIADNRLVLLACLLLAGCAALPQPEIAPVLAEVPHDFPLPYYHQKSATDVFEVTEAALTIKTYRAGWLKNLAHAHVMTTDTLTGFIHIDPEDTVSRANLYFRPYDLILDDPEARAEAGPEFSSHRSPKDIAATRQRMLGPRQLNSNDYPFIQIFVQPGGSAKQAALEIGVRDYLARKTVPISWHKDARQLTVNSEFRIRHDELGLQPYSAFAGALAVAQQIEVSLALVAIRADAMTAN